MPDNCQPLKVSKADPIAVHAYSAEWPVLFGELGQRLRTALGSKALRIDHIGSTAVVGLAAKPVIDVQISVAALEPVGDYGQAIEELGFIWRRDNDDRTKRYFREIPGARRTHIHVRRVGSWAEQFALLFRDYLRVSKEDCEAYERAKRGLAERFRDDRRAYTQAKTQVIWEIMQRANQWATASGWEPGATDA